MKQLPMYIGMLVLAILLAGCTPKNLPAETTAPSLPAETTICTTVPETEAPTEIPTETPTEAPTQPEHSPLYIPGLDVEDVIRYFNEVCLDAEFVNSGNASLLQKWGSPIYYTLYGAYTDEDLDTLTGFAQWLNTIEGFPGMYETDDPTLCCLSIYFCDSEELIDRMGDNFVGMDGAVTFWYMDNEIYDAIICYRTDLNQYLRNSVILEEIYNGLGPIQDTALRPDSIIFAEYSEPQALTEIDELILRLLYHPQMQFGMDAAECEAVIRQLYY